MPDYKIEKARRPLGGLFMYLFDRGRLPDELTRHGDVTGGAELLDDGA